MTQFTRSGLGYRNSQNIGIIEKHRIRSAEFQEGFAETVLYNPLVECGIEFRMHHIPRAVIQETDHVGGLPVNRDAVLDV